MSDNITLPRELVEKALEALLQSGERITLEAITALRAALAAPRPEPGQYQKQKERSYRLQRLLKECVKVMQANAVFRDTKVHKDLKTRIRVELEVQP
jgi:uncharacterized membrane protein YccC